VSELDTNEEKCAEMTNCLFALTQLRRYHSGSTPEFDEMNALNADGTFFACY